MNDRRMEDIVGAILRWGVIASGSVVLMGGVLYLLRHGSEATDYHAFRGQPAEDRYVGQIFAGMAHGRARSVMQSGILLLISTPVTRVAFSLVGFAMERDRAYVIVTTIVLTVLMYSLVAGAFGFA